MLYAVPGAEKSAVRAGLPVDKFPHRLTLQVSAENLLHPIEASFSLTVAEGTLRMTRLVERFDAR
jgi:hypothetical protein